ncbi:unnamed protein product [Closterium sp. NIES-53]
MFFLWCSTPYVSWLGLVPRHGLLCLAQALAPALARFRYKLRRSALLSSPFGIMASAHNTDHVTSEEQIPIWDDTLNELVGDFLVDDLPDGALPKIPDDAQPTIPDGAQPAPSDEHAAKKLCSKRAILGRSYGHRFHRVAFGIDSDSSGELLRQLCGHGPYGRTHADTLALRTVPASRSRPPPQEHAAAQAAVGPSSGLAPTARYRNLHRHGMMVGAVLQSLTRNTQSLVDITFPETPGEEVRAAVLAHISSLINGQASNGVVPSFESAAGEPLRLPRPHARHPPGGKDGGRAPLAGGPLPVPPTQRPLRRISLLTDARSPRGR